MTLENAVENSVHEPARLLGTELLGELDGFVQDDQLRDIEIAEQALALRKDQFEERLEAETLRLDQRDDDFEAFVEHEKASFRFYVKFVTAGSGVIHAFISIATLWLRGVF